MNTNDFLDGLEAGGGTNMTRSFTFTVTVAAETAEQAEQVMNERIGPDEDYGFDYVIEWDWTAS